jgi:hypothetical protein
MKAAIVPFDEPLDRARVRGLILEFDGNVTRAAERLKVEPERLRAYVNGVPSLKRAIDEALERAVDASIDVLYESLRDEGSLRNRFYAAKEFLRTTAGRRRGFGLVEPGFGSVEIRPAAGPVVLKWLEPPKEELEPPKQEK